MADLPLSSLLADLSVGLLVIDREGRVAFVNKRATEGLGLPPDLQGKPAVGVLPSPLWAMLHPLLENPSSSPVTRPMASSTTTEPLTLVISAAPLASSMVIEIHRGSPAAGAGGIASKIGHDLKTPLTSIKAYTEALTDLATDEQVKNFLGVINEETDRLVSMINELVRKGRETN